MLYSSENLFAAVTAKLLQSYPTVCDPLDGSPPGSSVLGILQARILEWVAISFSSACMHVKSLHLYPFVELMSFPGGSVVKNLLASAGDKDLIPEWGRSPIEGNDNPVQYSYLRNPMNRGTWGDTVHGVTKESDRTY